MAFLFLLLVLFAVLHLPWFGRRRYLRSPRDKGAVSLALAFLVAATSHFDNPQRFYPMMPPILEPWRAELIYLSGVFEVLGAAGLLVPRTRRAAGIGLAVLLLAVFPANIYLAVSGGRLEAIPLDPWYYWARLPFQFVYIAWALWASKRTPAPEAKVVGFVDDAR